MRTWKATALVAAIGALTIGPAAAQQVPSDTGTSAAGPITIFRTQQPSGTGVHVSINDSNNVDDLTRATYDDITGVVHPGVNTLTVRWDGPIQKLDFKIAYAATRNNFRNILVVQANANRDPLLRQTGARSFTFAIPG